MKQSFPSLPRTIKRIQAWFEVRGYGGQTLVELIVAISLTAVMMPALATALVAAREGRAQEAQRLEATALLREADEAVRSVREKGWSNIATNGTYYPSITGSSWSLTSGTQTIGSFTRSVVVADAQRNSSGALVDSGGTVDPSSKKVTITVSWNTPLAASVSNTSYYQRYLGNTTWTQTTQAEFAAGTETNTIATSTGGGQVELATGAGGGIAYVQSASSSNSVGAATIVQAFTGRVTGGNAIIVAVSWDTSSGTTTPTCSDNQANTYATATNTTDATNSQALAVCYATNVAGGSTTVTVTFNGSPTFRHIVVNEYSGVAASAPVDVTRTNIANGTTATDNVTSLAATTTTANDLIFGAIMDDTDVNTSITAGTNFTQRALTSTQLLVEDRILATPGSVAATATFGTAHRYLAHMVAFKPAGTAVAWAPPNIVGAYDNTGTTDALDVAVSGSYAYVAVGTTLRIVNISNPQSPTLTGTYTAAGTINSVAAHSNGNYVYLATTSTSAEFVAVNVTNRSSPTATVINLVNTNVGTSIAFANSRVYIGRALSTTAGQHEFFIYSASNPGSPTLEGSVDVTGQVNSISVPTADHAFVATSATAAEVTAIKINVPTAPTAAGSYDANGTSLGADIFANGNTLYLVKANNTGGPEFFILSASTAIITSVTYTLSGSYEAGASLNGVSVSGNFAFVAGAITNAQFRVLNVATPASITVVGSQNLADTGTDLTFDGTYAYVSSAYANRELTIMRSTPTVSGGGGYATSGTFESSSFDATASVGFNYLTFTITEPASTDVQFQLATNTDNATWNFVGPDGTSGTFYTAAGAVPLNKVAGRYFRYKATLTGPGTSTPLISDVTLNYSP